MTTDRRQFLFGTAALLLAACARGAKHSALPRGATVLALGDSLTYGYGAPPEAAYPHKLSELTGWQLINGGVSGDTSQQALARLPALMKQSPKLVLLGIGGNDFLRRVAEAEAHRHIGSTIAAVRAAGVPLVLIAEPQPSLGALVGSLSDHPLYADLAGEYRVPLFAGGWADILSDADLRSDAIHANARGFSEKTGLLARLSPRQKAA